MKNIRKDSPLKKLIGSKHFSFIVTITLFVLMYLVGMSMFPGFQRPQTFLNLFIDNAPLIIVTIGVTYVIITGGIDISVSGIVCLTCMMIASLLRSGLPFPIVICIVLLTGILIGFVQGFLITRFRLQPFIITLAGQFFAKGMAAVISRDTITIDSASYTGIAGARFYLGPGTFISVGVVIAILALIIGTMVLKYTKFGRNVYAVGGSEQSAELMGLPVGRTKISVYVVSGFCAALGGVVYSWIMLSGYTLHAAGMEMDAIASSVIGGTLLSGGVAFLPGTLVGVLLQGIIQTFITFQGTLSAWWTKIVIGILLCLFIVMQTMITNFKEKRKGADT